LKKIFLAFAALLAGATFANAETVNSKGDIMPQWYIGLHGNLPFASSSDIQSTNSSITYDSGWGAGAALGYSTRTGSFMDSFRSELEISYYRNYADRLKTPLGSFDQNGDLNAVTYMANLYYDVPTGMAITPYVGAGAGLARLEFDDGTSSDTDNTFVWQALAGISYAPDSLPNTEWNIGYRYLKATDPKFSGIKSEYEVNNVEAGAKFRF